MQAAVKRVDCGSSDRFVLGIVGFIIFVSVVMLTAKNEH